jgi:hypothetical protein
MFLIPQTFSTVTQISIDNAVTINETKVFSSDGRLRLVPSIQLSEPSPVNVLDDTNSLNRADSTIAGRMG